MWNGSIRKHCSIVINYLIIDSCFKAVFTIKEFCIELPKDLKEITKIPDDVYLLSPAMLENIFKITGKKPIFYEGNVEDKNLLTKMLEKKEIF